MTFKLMNWDYKNAHGGQIGGWSEGNITDGGNNTPTHMKSKKWAEWDGDSGLGWEPLLLRGMAKSITGLLLKGFAISTSVLPLSLLPLLPPHINLCFRFCLENLDFKAFLSNTIPTLFSKVYSQGTHIWHRKFPSLYIRKLPVLFYNFSEFFQYPSH